MEQTDLLDWLDGKKVIRAQPPSQSIQHRAFVIEQLAPIVRELETLRLSPLAVSEALQFYAGQFQTKAQNQLLNPNPIS